MNPILTVGLFGLLAALGALARSAVIEVLNNEQFPVGTLAVNLSGSLVAAIAVSKVPDSWATITAVGALGSFTTFSTFAVETADMWEQRRFAAALYGAFTVLGAIGLAVIGLGL